MKKKDLKIFIILCCIIMIIPLPIFAEELTFGQVLDDLTKAQQDFNKNQQQIDEHKGQINKDNETIKSLKSEIESMSNEVVELQQGIADANVEIEEKKEQTKDLLVYLQMSQGENIYLDYVFGGESITDLIYRLSIVEQLTEYNETMVKELEELITRNENRKVELAKKQEEYEDKITKLNEEKQKLANSINNLDDLSPGLEQEVKSKQQIVAYYRSEGCKNRSDVIGRDCAVSTTNAIFSRPIRTGYITSFIGYRWGSLHRGLDMGSSQGRNTPLYSIGNGVITSIWEDGNGAKCVNVQYQASNGTYYTAIYAHLSRYGNIKENMKVNTNTIIGYMGDTGYAFGVHLHLELWPCRLYVDNNCKTWSKYTQFVSSQYNKGFRGAESVISFPSRTYQTWYSR